MMLVLARYRDQSVILTLDDGRRIVVTVTDVRANGQVRLGFTAPEDVTVHRDEVQLKVEREGGRR